MRTGVSFTRSKGMIICMVYWSQHFFSRNWMECIVILSSKVDRLLHGTVKDKYFTISTGECNKILLPLMHWPKLSDQNRKGCPKGRQWKIIIVVSDSYPLHECTETQWLQKGKVFFHTKGNTTQKVRTDQVQWLSKGKYSSVRNSGKVNRSW